MLYAGTKAPIPLISWNKDAPGLCVKSLSDRDAAVSSHFSLPIVQYLGSTSGCGCDFPHVTLSQGEWVGYSDDEVDDPELEATEKGNRESLVRMLRDTGEKWVELYGIWLSRDGDYAKPVNFREDIPLARILEPAFRFKERGFYRVDIESSDN